MAARKNKKKQPKQDSMLQSAINLLPKDVRISEGIRGKAKKLKQASILTTISFIAISLSLVIYSFYLNRQIQDMETQKEDLMANIVALEGTEQRLVLYRDRILKLQALMATQTVNKALDLQEESIDAISNVNFENATLTESEQSVSVSNSTSQNIRDYLTQILNLPYQSLVLSDITFNNLVGFQAEFSYARQPGEDTN